MTAFCLATSAGVAAAQGSRAAERATADLVFECCGNDTLNSNRAAPRRTHSLSVEVRHGGKVQRQVFAKCADYSAGTALGGGTETLLTVAYCDAEPYWLVSLPGEVLVRKGGDGEESRPVVARIALPSGKMRAALP